MESCHIIRSLLNSLNKIYFPLYKLKAPSLEGAFNFKTSKKLREPTDLA